MADNITVDNNSTVFIKQINKLLKTMELQIVSSTLDGKKEIFYHFFNLVSEANENRLSNLDRTHFNQKEIGAYYTPAAIASKLTSDLLKGELSPTMSILEPCSGLGALYFSFLDSQIMSKNTTSNFELINNIIHSSLLVEIDPFTVSLFKKLFKIWTLATLGQKIPFPNKNIICSDFILNEPIIKKRSYDLFGTYKFDYIISNPPYKILKPSASDSYKFKSYINEIKNHVISNPSYVLQQGTLNLYKIIIENILNNYTKNGSFVGLVLPSGVLKDLSSRKIREYLILNTKISNIRLYEESKKVFKNASLEFTTFVFKVGLKSKEIAFFDNNDREISRIFVSEIKNTNNSYSLHPYTMLEKDFLLSLSKFQKLGDSHDLLNLRGEIDLTLNKDGINLNNSGLKLYKGRHIESFRHSHSNLYHTGLLDSSPKKNHSKFPRIGCQQISNSSQAHRMKWSYFEKNVLLANSCNYITLLNKNQSADFLYFLLGLLNSKVINYFFVLNSYNNHISNDEISKLPLVSCDANNIFKIANLSKKILKTNQDYDKSQLISALDSLVYDLYFDNSNFKKLLGVK